MLQCREAFSDVIEGNYLPASLDERRIAVIFHSVTQLSLEGSAHGNHDDCNRWQVQESALLSVFRSPAPWAAFPHCHVRCAGDYFSSSTSMSASRSVLMAVSARIVFSAEMMVCL